MTPRECCIYLALKFNGDYQKLRAAIMNREEIPKDEKIPQIKSKVLTILDEEYPEELKKYYLCPLVLFYYGDISLIHNLNKNLAVIGSRSVNKYGMSVTKDLVSPIAKHVNIVSGLAKGIDSLAQRTAIESGGKVIAVLGSGIDYCYPKENLNLYEEIKKNHLIISEYPSLCEPSPDKFPVRNRIIAMLSNTVLITQANMHSGTSITATYALNYNKNVCCVPHSIYSKSLCNDLIANGAYLVEKSEDILDIMNIKLDKEIFDL